MNVFRNQVKGPKAIRPSEVQKNAKILKSGLMSDKPTVIKHGPHSRHLTHFQRPKQSKAKAPPKLENMASKCS